MTEQALFTGDKPVSSVSSSLAFFNYCILLHLGQKSSNSKTAILHIQHIPTYLLNKAYL